jgi:hypothetical protein
MFTVVLLMFLSVAILMNVIELVLAETQPRSLAVVATARSETPVRQDVPQKARAQQLRIANISRVTWQANRLLHSSRQNSLMRLRPE